MKKVVKDTSEQQEVVFQRVYKELIEIGKSHEEATRLAREVVNQTMSRGSGIMNIGNKFYNLSKLRKEIDESATFTEIDDTSSVEFIDSPNSRRSNGHEQETSQSTSSTSSGALEDFANRVQYKYGANPISPGADLDITYAQLEDNIATLKKAIEALKSSWNGEIKRNIDKINSSWIGKDCATYTSKLSNMDGKVQKTVQALELLCSTYEKARDMVASSKKQVTNAVDYFIN